MYVEMSGGGSSTPTETSLWTNPTPTTSMPNNYAATLSEDYTNFDCIKIRYRYSTSRAYYFSATIGVGDMEYSSTSASTTNPKSVPFFGLQFGATVTKIYYRRIFHQETENNKTLRFSANYGTSTTADNDYTIPVELIGIKY